MDTNLKTIIILGLILILIASTITFLILFIHYKKKCNNDIHVSGSSFSNNELVGFLRNINPHHPFSEEDVLDMIATLGNTIRLATEADVMKPSVRPLQSVFWFLNERTGRLETASKHNKVTFRPMKYRTSPDIAIVYSVGFDWKEHLPNHIEFIQAEERETSV